MGRLDGKVAIITGAAGGMGFEAAKLFASEGAAVIAADIQEEVLAGAYAEFDARPGSITTHVLDISEEEQWHALVGDVLAEHGKIDVLVNNAAIGSFVPLEDCTAAEFLKIYAVDVVGPALGMKAVIPAMKANGGGSIVNTSSCSAITPELSVGTAYAAAKGAIVPMTKHEALANAQFGIRINSVIPGAVHTPGIAALGISFDDMAASFRDKSPLPPHAGLPINVAHAYLFLASDESSFMTGVALPVDGGNTM